MVLCLTNAKLLGQYLFIKEYTLKEKLNERTSTRSKTSCFTHKEI